MSRDERLHAVRTYVIRNPGCTCRDVAREVLGGTGDTRTSERGQAYGVLCRLEDMGHVRREKPEGDYSRRKADLWHPM